jgi:hypothetical protein
MFLAKPYNWTILLLVASFNCWATTNRVELRPFNQIQLNGNMQVEIHAGTKYSALQVETTSQQHGKIKLKVLNQVLILEQTSDYKTVKPKVIIYGPTLTALTINGSNEVKVINLYSNDFSLYSANQGDIAIQGEVGLKNLFTQGVGKITLYWLNTPELTIMANGSTQVELGGKVTTLHATLGKASMLNARYLATTNAYIRTADDARVDIAAKQILNAQALGQSNIYYYQQPSFLGQHMYQSGAVLNAVGESLVN